MSKRFSVVLTLTLLVTVIFSCSRASNRQMILLSGEWLFYADSLNIGGLRNFGEKGVPDSLGRFVNVPHAWNSEVGMENYWGKCWYQRSFDVQENQLSKITRIQFDAIYHDAIIWINGQKAGSHIGSGYNRFYINATPYLKPGKNILTVLADNSPSRTNIPFLKSFDWANDGGLYRNVYEIITEKQAIRSIQVNALPKGATGMATIKVNFIDISSIDKSKLILKAILCEENTPEKKVVFRGDLKGEFVGESYISNLLLEKVKPWHFDSPNLYRLDIQLLIDGVRKDTYFTTFGYRRIEVKNGRYLLNGEPMRLMGVEWMPGSSPDRGMAETKGEIVKNLTLMKNANCVLSRFHWQQDDFVFDWCDRNGILIQEEIPLWGGATVLNDTLVDLGVEHLNEMVEAHFNHPSIISWGVGNELLSHDTVNISFLKKLFYHARALDSSRLVNYVSNSLHWGFPGEGNFTGDATSESDMMMYNEYFTTWYNGNLNDIAPALIKIDSAYHGKPLTISEWGLCEPVHKGGDARRCQELIKQIEIYESLPDVSGAIYFCLNDYRTHMGEDYSFHYPQRVHGVCDLFLNKKPSYDTLKTISSPVILKNLFKNGDSTYVTIIGRKGIPEYIVRNYYLISGNQKVIIDTLAPGDSARYVIRSDAGGISIMRPTGFEVLVLPEK